MIPAAIACGGGSSSSPAAASPSASYGAMPPGYPQTGTYPPQQGANPQQPGYPPQQGYVQQPAQQGYPQPAGNAYPPPATAQASLPPGATAGPAAPSAAPSASSAPLGQVVTTDPNQLAQIFAQAAAAGQAALQTPGAVPGDPVELGLKAAALKHAAGEQPQGQIAKGTLQEGGHLAFTVTMQPGTCYTIIGYSPPGQVKNLDLHLLAPPFYNLMAGQDVTDNNVPTVGATPNPLCPVIPVALQYKVDIAARAGSGNVGVEVFAKSK
jgi:hypothetical protein